jgi:tetratricopeptide (TPR) repeat protein
MALAAGDRIGRYEILAPLGAGGMGEVYRARDSVLDREVAVKVLPEALVGDEERLERFEREAKSVARLSHPGILEIYDFGSDDGVHYAVMELLEGDTLRTRIPPSGLPWQRAVEIGAAVADGLAAAHDRGVVHRDLKPENLFVTSDGRVKVLDFGLARVQEEVGPEEETGTLTPAGTEAGTILGTVGYMAPEQVRGRPADHRSDVFALGCVLYEMVSGRKAFGRDTRPDTMAAILTEEPDELSGSGVVLPADLERAIRRCLDKRPEARFQSAADLAYSLRSIGTGPAVVMATPIADVRSEAEPRRLWLAAAAAIVLAMAAVVVWRLDLISIQPATPRMELIPNRILVVPFKNRTGDPSLDRLGVVAADRIAQALSELDEVDVVPASGVEATRAGTGAGNLISGVAVETAAALVLTGVYDALGNSIELQMNLEDAAAGRIVRAFDPVRAPRDAPQGAIAALCDWTLIAVQDHLHPLLAWGGGDRFPKIDAYNEYRTSFQVSATGNHPQAISHIGRALKIDPELDRARLQVGRIMGNVSARMRGQLQPFFEPILERRDRLNAGQQEILEGIQAQLDRDWTKALGNFRQVLERTPDNCLSRLDVIRNAVRSNRPNEAVAVFQDLVWDPLAPSSFRVAADESLAEALHLLGRHEEELTLARRLRESQPVETTGGWPGRSELVALAAMGRETDLNTRLSEALLDTRSTERAIEVMTTVANELRAHGFDDASARMADRTLRWLETSELDLPDYCDVCHGVIIADMMALLGRPDDGYAYVLEAFEDAQEDGDKWLSIGIAAARAGDDETAREMAARFAREDDPERPDFGRAYNRACIAAQLGEREEALRLLREAIVQGLPDIISLHCDLDLEPLWDDPESQELVRPKG